MRPRTEVTFVDGSLNVGAARSMLRDRPFLRYPVINKNPDDVLGFVHP